MRAAELLVRDGIARYEAGENAGAEANMAKMLAADASWAAGEACIQTHGGFGFAAESDIERKFRETRLHQVETLRDMTCVVLGKRVSDSVESGGCRFINK